MDSNMSEDHSDEEINFNELVGNLLNSHNELQVHDDMDIDIDNDYEDSTDKPNNMNTEHENVELLDFGNEDVDLAAVANAMQHFDTSAHDEEQHQTEYDDEDDQLNQEWAHALAQGLLQATENSGHIDENQQEEQLDQDDVNLRNAILESLQHINTEKPSSKKKTKVTNVSKQTKSTKKDKPEEVEKVKKDAKKKSAKKKKKEKSKEKDIEKEKNVTIKKKKKHAKDSKSEVSTENLLNFEDVIKGFIQQGDENPKVSDDNETTEDPETQALVEATLKAFEKELLGPATKTKQPRKTLVKKTLNPSKRATTAISAPAVEKKAPKTTSLKPTTSVSTKPIKETQKKRKKKEKKEKKEKKSSTKEVPNNNFEEDDFSRALVEMVNQVVNTSLTDSNSQVTASQSHTISDTQTFESSKASEEIAIETDTAYEDSFDLNQIMQKAMALAFQDQSHQRIDQSEVDDFNRGLGDFSVSDLLTPGIKTGKKKTSSKKKVALEKHVTKKVKVPKPERAKKSKEKVTKENTKKVSVLNKVPKPEKEFKAPKPPKPTKPLPSPEEILRKKYAQLAKEVASVARKKQREKSRHTRTKLRENLIKVREERRLKKTEEKEKLEVERKELEDIVAKGPPYPVDLRLTKRGEPKKPYRRWTEEELYIRASMPPEEPKKPKKVKKVKKKKAKKLKKIPLSALKRIPLFNFVKDNLAPNLEKKSNGLQNPVSSFQNYKVELNKLAPPSSMSVEEMERRRQLEEKLVQPRIKKEKVLIFNPHIKTVVRKEKMLFHPPWNIPEHPPLSIPIARRTGKKYSEKLKEAKRKAKAKKISKSLRHSLTVNARNTIVPAILYPIINTLKAAARAKAAAGVSPEEATKHLMAIIQHTKKSIAQSLAQSRRNVTRNYTHIKSEDEVTYLYKKANTIKKIPIFSLSKIKQIDTSDDLNTKMPVKIKMEEVEEVGAPPLVNTDSVVQFDDNINHSTIDIELLEEKKSDAISSQTTAIDKKKPSIDSNKEQLQESEAVNLNVAVNNSKSTTDRKTQDLIIISEESEEVPFVSMVEPNENEQLQELDSKNVEMIVETLVKEQIDKSNKEDDDILLPSNLTNIISSTITDLLPTLENESIILSKKRVYTKPPAPILNLDGLVPPIGSSRPKLEENHNEREFKPFNEVSSNDYNYNRIGIFKKKSSSEQPETLSKTQFNIPSNNAGHNKRSSAVKFARALLNTNEITLLTKEINKERKRKWRNANIVKNWENDVRARLKKRSKVELIDLTDDEKNNWIEIEFSKRKTEFNVKNEDVVEASVDSPSGSSNITENEILNMIGNILNREDIARKIEQKLIDEASNPKPRKRKRTDSLSTQSTTSNSMLDVVVHPIPPVLIDKKAQTEAISSTVTIHPDSNTFKPYPDDIPITIVKKPKLIDADSK